MTKGDKIKLIAPMGVLTNIGEIYEVTNVEPTGVISFKFGDRGQHLAVMSYDEFQRYFELYTEPSAEPEPETIKNIWTEWKPSITIWRDIEDELVEVPLLTRENGKRLQMKLGDGTIKSEATCHKDDVFDYDTGWDIAWLRLYTKWYKQQVDSYIKEL